MSQNNTFSDIELPKGYNGNINIKPANVPMHFTPEQRDEWLRCARDPIYFSENYIKIVNLDDGLIQISLYDYQKDIIKSVQDNRNTIVLTSRQAGKTTSAVCLILHYVLFNEFATVALLANKSEAAREILSRIQLAYEWLPKWLQQGVKVWNKGDIELENGCKIIACSTTSSSIRGKSISFVYIDETAFVENWDEFFNSVFPTISSGKNTKILFTSTPNGLNHFYNYWELANKDKDSDEWNEYNPILVRWTDVPGRDEKWKKKQLAGMNFDVQKFKQEYECEFEGSSGTLISGEVLKMLSPKTPIHQEYGINMYESPVKDHIYVITADVGRGKGHDYSVFSVIDITELPYKQVCVFRNNMINTVDFSEVLYKFIKFYNDAHVIVEINDIGGQVADILYLDYEVETLINTESKGRAGKRISLGFSANVERGIRTTKTVKSIGCTMLQMLVENHKLIINDMDTIHELSTFSRKGKSYEADPGSHDDIVMGLVLFGWMTNDSFFKELSDQDVLKALQEKSEEQLMNELLPFGFLPDDEDSEIEPGYTPYNPSDIDDSTWNW